MSTVVLTPTHIASDHSVIHDTYPHTTVIDQSYQKIFIDPDKKFILGTVGEFNPHQIDTPETYALLEDLIREIIVQSYLKGFGFNLIVPIQKDVTKGLEKVLDSGGHSFLVTKTHRYLYYRENESRIWCAKRCDNYTGIGSGGMAAVGLLLGKIPLPQIWQPLHLLDKVSSVEHTSIPLKILKPWKEKLHTAKDLKW